MLKYCLLLVAVILLLYSDITNGMDILLNSVNYQGVCLLGKALNDFITHYEVLNYNVDSLMTDHRRLTRSINGPRHIQLQFNALGRAFNLQLYQGSPSLTSDAVVMVDDRPISHYKSLIYHGVDKGDNISIISWAFTSRIVYTQMTIVLGHMVMLLEEYLPVKYILRKILISSNHRQGSYV